MGEKATNVQNKQSDELSFGSMCFETALGEVRKLVKDIVESAIEPIKQEALEKAKKGQFQFVLDRAKKEYNRVYMVYGYVTPPRVDVEDMIRSGLEQELLKLRLYLYRDFTDAYSQYDYCVSFYDRHNK